MQLLHAFSEDDTWGAEHLELDALNGIVRKFAHELLNDPDEPLIELHFGCNFERIEWDDQDFSHMEIAPRVTVSIDFEELGKGRFNAMTPEGIHHFLFRGRYRKRVNEGLITALELERKRAAHGHECDLHLSEIKKNLLKARSAFLASCRAGGL
ncbi:hypothetical protein [Rhizobium sullae]|uniref:hypothetical protein n=1 Tax=Rhizobium sullae TaxID=50338 RepID=UPI0010501A56|nr:hypothetical protein [Rhizobium sullae]